MGSHTDTVVLLKTWDRPTLLRQSLPQVLRETERIGGQLVICDDHSSDEETLGLLQQAREAGAEVIRPPNMRGPEPRLDRVVHADPKEALRTLATLPGGAELISRGARRGERPEVIRRGLLEFWNQCLADAHTSAQKNQLFGLRHVLARYSRAAWLINVDDDLTMRHGAFELMLRTWSRAEDDGHDVLAVSGIRTLNERASVRFGGYTITVGICHVAVVHRRADWQRLLDVTPERDAIRKGWDLTLVWDYAPRYRPGAVAVTVSPSVVYHTGKNGVHVRDTDLNCEYAGPMHGIVVS
jgi:hypothetical protein